jgi:hypothetical protein
LISKYDKPRRLQDKKRKYINGVDLEFQKFNFYKQIPYRPPIPPKAVGFVEKMGNFIINYYSRYIEIDPTIGSLRRFKKLNDYPNDPK